MELERRSIERADFSQARRGYDPGQVDRHLAEIASAVEELRRSQEAERSASTVAGAAANRVKSIVDAAEQSAATIESEARAEAERVTGDANRHAEETRTQAESAAATHLAKVEEASERMRTRADAVESDLNGLVDDLRQAVAAAVDDVRANAKSMGAELAAMQADLAEAGEARGDVPGPSGAATSDTPSEGAPEETGEPEAEVRPAGESVGQEVSGGAPREATSGAAAADAPTPSPPAADSAKGDGVEGARLVALNMALNGTPREETARYLEQNFKLDDRDKVLEEAYARIKG